MKQLLSACLWLPLAHAVTYGGPTEAAIMATMRLSDQPNYSWVATISDDARTYDIDGKIVRGGFTNVKMPVINAVRRRLGRDAADPRVELLFRGNVACVIRTGDGWLSPHELPWPDEPETDLMVLPGPSIGPMAGGSIRGSLQGTVLQRTRIRDPREREDRAYSNLQLAVSPPHEELAVIVGSHQDLKVEGETVRGTLTDLGAQLLLVRDGQKEITPLRATGSFTLWMREGLVAKYQVRLEGVLLVDTPRGRREIEVHQSTDTIVKNIGTTVVEVPAQARTKLERLASNLR